mmetsp:Transcript_69653/g.166231  ORF Transcript_69653/g.166231 Transcript_69653/m.166231 type:complete len:302 (+) Transcript_69653:514-1419(+)
MSSCLVLSGKRVECQSGPDRLATYLQRPNPAARHHPTGREFPQPLAADRPVSSLRGLAAQLRARAPRAPEPLRRARDLLCRRLPLRGRGTVPARRLFGVPGAAGGGHGAEAANDQCGGLAQYIRGSGKAVPFDHGLQQDDHCKDSQPRQRAWKLPRCLSEFCREPLGGFARVLCQRRRCDGRALYRLPLDEHVHGLRADRLCEEGSERYALPDECHLSSMLPSPQLQLFTPAAGPEGRPRFARGALSAAHGGWSGHRLGPSAEEGAEDTEAGAAGLERSGDGGFAHRHGACPVRLQLERRL